MTVGEITSEPANGYKGNHFLYTALILSDKVSAILTVEGGIHNNVSIGAWHARAHRRRTKGYDPILPVPHKWCFVKKILLLASLTIFEDSRD